MNIIYCCAVQSVNELKHAHQNENALKILKQTKLLAVELNEQPMYCNIQNMIFIGTMCRWGPFYGS